MCLAACDKAPMLQCNFHYHEHLDMDIMRALIAQWRAEAGVEAPTGAESPAEEEVSAEAAEDSAAG